MEGTPAEPPLKVCPHCSVASRTDSETCPSCGKSYVRGGGVDLKNVKWSWWFAIPIVVAAFAIGYFGISQLFDTNDTGDGVITAEQAEAVPPGASRAELDEELDGEEPAVTRADCLIYLLEDPPPKVRSFCFVDDKLLPSTQQGNGPPAAPPAP